MQQIELVSCCFELSIRIKAANLFSMNRSSYNDTFINFKSKSPEQILGTIITNSDFSIETTQRDAWVEELGILRTIVEKFNVGHIFIEYTIPRLAKRIDALLIIDHCIFVLEFKIGATSFNSSDLDQVCDYALDLKNFHSESHSINIVPILISTKAKNVLTTKLEQLLNIKDNLFSPIKANTENVVDSICYIIKHTTGKKINIEGWTRGRYFPTPTIIEAAIALYNAHSVENITRNDAGATNLSATSNSVSSIIEHSRNQSRKSICFVTGVPGAGKTLVGLNIATKYHEKENELHSIYLSGNGPLVKVLNEALALDRVSQAKNKGLKYKLSSARSEVRAFIQNVHHFRDGYIEDPNPPAEHVVLFDEAQRAWDKQQTKNFMERKRRVSNFEISEAEFLISCLDRHKDWAVVICLVGEGQEINTGEAGIIEWLNSIKSTFTNWDVYVSPKLFNDKPEIVQTLSSIKISSKLISDQALHLSTSIRSYRAENLSMLVSTLLELDQKSAIKEFSKLEDKYPIVITRNINSAKQWLREQARGSERYGIVVSSQAERLKPYAINVKVKIDPVNWFLKGKSDIRSSYFLEDVATEFHVQGLELDWVCVAWDADFRFHNHSWDTWSFKGSRWQKINKAERKEYIKNAYRVLLTRARQGMVILIPEGDTTDPTRDPKFYQSTFEYLKGIGFNCI